MSTVRTPLIAANWKANQRWEDCEAFIVALQRLKPELFELDEDPPVDVLICPPYPYIPLLGTLLEEAAIFLGGQDVSRYKDGAYTGDVTAGMLEDLECDYCIVGHSERRSVFGDSNEIVAGKLARLWDEDILPVLCIGEALDVRKAGRAVEHTLGQLDAVKSELHRLSAGRLVIAYEPIWAIGTGENAEPTDAQEMAQAIRGWLRDMLGSDHTKATPVLYGGSVKPANAGEYFAQQDIDGALVGGASLEAESFAALIDLCLAQSEE